MAKVKIIHFSYLEVYIYRFLFFLKGNNKNDQISKQNSQEFMVTFFWQFLFFNVQLNCQMVAVT